MFWRKVGYWFLFFTLLAVIAAGGAAYWFLTNKDRLLEERVRQTIAEKYPDWNLTYDAVRFDWHENLTLTGVRLAPKSDDETIAEIPELTLILDGDRFRASQAVEIVRIVVKQPTVTIERYGDGSWNWQKLLPLSQAENAPAVIQVRDATLHLSYQHHPDSAPVAVTVSQPRFDLLPASRRRYAFEGVTQIDSAGLLTVSGTYDMDRRGWTVEGVMNDVIANDTVFDLASKASPQLGDGLSKLRSTREGPLPNGAPIQTADGSGSAVPEQFRFDPQTGNVVPITQSERDASAAAGGGASQVGIGGELGLRLRLEKWSPETALQYRVLVDVRRGQFSNPLLPFPLHDLSGQIYVDNQQIVCSDVRAANGQSRLEFDGRIAKDGTRLPGTFTFKVSDLEIDERVRSRLPASILNLHDTLRPTGRVSLSGELVSSEDGSWTTKDVGMTLADGTLRPQFFGYPITSISASVQQTGRELTCTGRGMAGSQPVTLSGRVLNPGPEAECHFTVRTGPVPIDETLLVALPDGARRGLQELNLTGRVAATVQVDRIAALPAGAGPEPISTPTQYADRSPVSGPPSEPSRPKWQIGVALGVRQASLTHAAFPYRIEDLSGRVTWSSELRRWDFSELQGSHGAARITGSGQFVQGGPSIAGEVPPSLRLSLAATDVPLDRSLYEAVPTSLQDFWDEVGLAGEVDVNTEIEWDSLTGGIVTLPSWTLRNGSFSSRSHPYAISEASASGSYEPGKVVWKSFTGKHGGAVFSAKGSHIVEEDETWRIRLDEFAADDVPVDRDLLAALPPELGSGFKAVKFSGKPISIAGMIELRGTKPAPRSGIVGHTEPVRPTVTAAWDLETVFGGNNLALGVDLKSVFGVVSSRGTWDGKSLKVSGQLDLDSVFVMEHQFTRVRGPYVVADQQIIAGSREILSPQPGGQPNRFVPLEERISGQAIGGTVTLDLFAVLDEQPAYRAKMTLNNGQLQQYAKRYAPGMRNLAGVLNGWIDVYGRGSDRSSMQGQGQVQISPAAIYETPIVLQMLRQFTSLSNDRVAFRYAFADFNIAREQFVFNVIDLVGSSISFRGKGWCRFDGQLALDFFSMMGRSQVNVPLLGPLVNELSRGWVGVEVRGRVNAPTARMRAVPELDNALRGFLGTFNPANATLPTLRFPR